MRIPRTRVFRQSARLAQTLRSVCLALVSCAAIGTTGASGAAATEFGIVPGSVTARTCAAAEVTCSSSSAPETQAGAHPTGTVSFSLNAENAPGEPLPIPIDRVKDVVVQLPAGFVGNAQAVPQCTLQQILRNCPRITMVGYTVIESGNPSFTGVAYPAGTIAVPVFNLVPQKGQAALLGFVDEGAVVLLEGTVRTGGDDGVNVVVHDITNQESISSTTTFWGVPAEHNGPGPIAVSRNPFGLMMVGGPGEGLRRPFLTNPSDCSTGELATRLNVDPWSHPAKFLADGEPDLGDPVWQMESVLSPQPTGCEDLPFSPSLSFQPVTHQIDKPSGYEVGLTALQEEHLGLAAADLRDVAVKLPIGVSVDPSAADGLQGCTDAQLAYGSGDSASCSPASQIGEAEVETTLLAPHSVTGRIYLGTPLNNDPTSGEMYRLFLVLDGPGLQIKIKGSAVADPATGQLTATFKDNPQLPFSELKLDINGGDHAVLANPPWCETASTTSVLRSYAQQTVTSIDPLSFSHDGFGAACPASIPFNPGFTAGTMTPLAGSTSPFSLSLSRADGEQTFSQISTALPTGLLANLKGVPRCGEPQAAAGTCDASSQIGTTTVGTGAGPHPLYVSGRVYLTGAYKGAPFGLSVAVPAIAGPYNLGTVVVRASIYVNAATSAVSVASGPVPQMLDGIPLRIKRIDVEINRPGFTFNPTNCAAQAVTGAITAGQGATATVVSAFHVAGCNGLSFHPMFTASSRGQTSKVNGASLDVRVAQTHGEANIQKVAVQLPTSLPSRLTTLQKACIEAQFATNPAGCPAGSNVGTATATTPVLNLPLSGPAYLVSRGAAAFPDLVIVLQGEGITIELVGHTKIKNGITYSRFDTVPDVPISSFRLNLPEGPHSALAPHGDLCSLGATSRVVTRTSTRRVHGRLRKIKVKKAVKKASQLVMPTTITGQNGKQIVQNTKIAVTGCTSVEAKRPKR
jgi:hypothetical protein